MPRGGTLTILTANRVLEGSYCANQPELKPGPYAMIAVTDTGSGMTPDVVSQIFEPFFTTKAPGHGTGLGLSMVFGFLKQSQGHISAYSEPGLGTTFRLYLPRASTDAQATAPAVRPDILYGHGEIVLVVEDNAQLRSVAVRQLTGLGYQALDAESGVSALSVLRRQHIDLVFSDVVLAGELDGAALAQAVLATWPAVKIVLTTGYAGDRIKNTIDSMHNRPRLLAKPYRLDELARAVRSALDATPEDLDG
jgi:CheY-like chemotaxis protein